MNRKTATIILFLAAAAPLLFSGAAALAQAGPAVTLPDPTVGATPVNGTWKTDKTAVPVNGLITIPIPDLKFSDILTSDKPLPGATSSPINVPWLAEYITAVYKYGVAIAGVLAAVMMMIGGMQYLTAGGDSGRVSKGKEKIADAVLGLFLVLATYMILYVINPEMVNLRGFTMSKVEKETYTYGKAPMPADVFQKVTGKPLPSPEQAKAMLAQYATSQGLDPCMFTASAEHESAGFQAAIIGHDENWPGPGVTSRKRFIKDQLTYQGKKFKADPNSFEDITNKKILNDDDAIKDEPNLGLDWRYTHGIGLGQITPGAEPGAGMTPHNCPGTQQIGRTINGKCYTVRELLDPMTAAQTAAVKFKDFEESCAPECEGAKDKKTCVVGCSYYKYNGNGCSARASQCRKMNSYAKCAKIPSPEPKPCSYWVSKERASSPCDWKDQE